MQQQSAAYELWARHCYASDHLAGKMLKIAEQKFKEDIDIAWQDFNMTAFPELLDVDSPENQIFFPYFIFQWDFGRRRSRKGGPRKVGVVARWFTLEKAASLSEMERLYLEQAAVQPVSFYEVLRSVPGERVEVRDVLIGGKLRCSSARHRGLCGKETWFTLKCGTFPDFPFSAAALLSPFHRSGSPP